MKILKICKDCGEKRCTTSFWKDKQQKSGLKPYCKDCCKIRAYDYRHRNKEKIKAYMKKHILENKKHYQDYHNKYKSITRNKYYRKIMCRTKLHLAIKRGDIKKRNSCEICHRSPTHCHHEDYSKPYEYIELCKRCHVFLHQQYVAQGIIIS